MNSPDPNSAPAEERRPDLIPARMLNEYAYCPRLFHLEYVDGLFADSADTVEGRAVHRRTDEAEDSLPEAGPDEPPAVTRSITLSSDSLGLIAKIDLLETEGNAAVPVDTKRGRAPNLPEGAYESERVQLCAQGLLLQEHGFDCDHGFIYFAASRKRVRIEFTPDLGERTRSLLKEAREASGATAPPAPLVDSPKCPRCSLVGICLPDEVNHLKAVVEGVPPEPRRLVPARDDAVPVYLQGHGMSISKKGESIEIKGNGEMIQRVLLKDVSHLAIFGTNHLSVPVMQALAGRDVPITLFSEGGWFYGVLHGMGLKNVYLRRQQFRSSEDPQRCLDISRHIVAGKISNCRTLLMRNHGDPPRAALDALREHRDLALDAADIPALLGIEGNAARIYFAEFEGMLKPRGNGDGLSGFEFKNRNRRPPRDPVNAMLSLTYSLLAKDLTVILMSVGFDPFIGFYHQIRHGRPALALDLMEELRPLIGDSVVLTAINNGEVGKEDFLVSTAGCAFTEDGRKRFIQAYERRLDTLVTHPIFDYRVSYRRILEIQARLLGRYLEGEIVEYPPFMTR